MVLYTNLLPKWASYHGHSLRARPNCGIGPTITCAASENTCISDLTEGYELGCEVVSSEDYSNIFTNFSAYSDVYCQLKILFFMFEPLGMSVGLASDAKSYYRAAAAATCEYSSSLVLSFTLTAMKRDAS